MYLSVVLYSLYHSIWCGEYLFRLLSMLLHILSDKKGSGAGGGCQQYPKFGLQKVTTPKNIYQNLKTWIPTFKYKSPNNLGAQIFGFHFFGKHDQNWYERDEIWLFFTSFRVNPDHRAWTVIARSEGREGRSECHNNCFVVL